MSYSLSGDGLFADVLRYEGFGVHRFGSPGADAALGWIADELGKAGFAVERQAFSVARQYECVSAALRVSGRDLAVVPQWWPPPAQASFRLTAPIVPAGPATGCFVRLTLPYDRGAYLTAGHRLALEEAFARDPAALLLDIDHPSGEIFTYNVDQSMPPWPCPVVLAAPRDRTTLDACAGDVTLAIDGRYRESVPGHNVVGRLDRGTGRWFVVSTPVTSWFTSTCERGPGIAGFLATARLAAARFADVDLLFVATAGHEIGHGGMQHFLRAAAPAPDSTVVWAHFGATLASHDMLLRVVARSAPLEALTDRTFAAVDGTRLGGREAAVGEIRDVQGAGYPAFFGMAAVHRLFHTPADSASGTSAELLLPVVRAYVETLEALRPGRALSGT
ncbi:MAG: hypothetical protein KIT25_04020 [Enhydrobacter sp.]|nr:MAG: hypothetical protein KIT25_04020 [Enhydrobacter sp.]